jgi:thiosulfate dehydrogenase [quinone] large subunit
VRVSAGFGIFLMLTYWTAHMDFPYIGGPLNFLIDEHIVYALVLGLLIVRRAGHIVGLDEWVAQRHLFDRVPLVHWASA